MNEKEYLYVGHYIDEKGNYILKVGTTNNLQRRKYEHNKYYHKTKHHQMPKDEKFTYDWYKEFSSANTKKYEENAKEEWKNDTKGTYIPKDRFCYDEKPTMVSITIKKTYEIYL